MKKTIVSITLLITFCLCTTSVAAEESIAKAGKITAPVSSCMEYQQALESGKTVENTRKTQTQAKDLTGMSEEEIAASVGKMCQQDYQTSGILASVSAAQCILESGFLSTTLATDANNCFGMKITLSDNSWANSSWDGVSSYRKETWEEYDGQVVNIMADFRSYPCMEDSIADHTAYLLGATSDSGQRYAGLKGEKDYVTAIQIIKNGGYATDSNYVNKICDIIQRYNLTQYDVLGTVVTASAGNSEDAASAGDTLYRVRKSWEDATSQIGAYASKENALDACKEGYHVYDSDGNEVSE